MERERENPRERRNPNGRHSNFDSSPRSTIFVSNLPKNLDIFGFKGIFRKIDTIVDAVIPVSQGGRRRFGFIRFRNHDSVGKSIQIFNNKVIRESKIYVFEAKRDTIRNQIKKDGFVDAEKVRKEKEDEGGRRYWKQDYRHQASGLSNSHAYGNNSDFFNIKNVSKKFCAKGSVNKDRVLGLLCSLVGETELPVRVDFIWDILNRDNIGVVKVLAIQKNKFILEFVNEDKADLALTGSQSLANLFSNLKKWAWTDHPEKRFAWLEVRGLPPQGWNLGNFKIISSKWGRLVGFDRNFEESIDLESIKMLVLTNKMRFIEDDMLLALDSFAFKIWVEEIEEPELKQFYKAETFEPKSKSAQMSESEEEEEGKFGEEASSAKSHSDSAEEEGEVRVEDSVEDVGSLTPDSVEAENLESIDEAAENLVSSEEADPMEDAEGNYDSDDLGINIISIPPVLNPPGQVALDLREMGKPFSEEALDHQPASFPSEVDSIRMPGQVEIDTLATGLSKGSSTSNKKPSFSKRNFKIGDKRKCISLSPKDRGRGRSGRSRIIKRRKSVIEAVHQLSEDSSDSVHEDAERSVGLGRLLGVKPVGNVDKVFKRVRRAIKKHRRFVVEEDSDVDSAGSQDF